MIQFSGAAVISDTISMLPSHFHLDSLLTFCSTKNQIYKKCIKISLQYDEIIIAYFTIES